eukprot:scaffold33312_cov19-Tisochrysis_lutea.AAC.1
MVAMVVLGALAGSFSDSAVPGPVPGWLHVACAWMAAMAVLVPAHQPDLRLICYTESLSGLSLMHATWLPPLQNKIALGHHTLDSHVNPVTSNLA